MIRDESGYFTPDQAGAIADLLTAQAGSSAMTLRISRTSGGQSNPTFFLDWPGGSAVLRKQPSGELAPSAHAIDREYRLLEALKDSPVPVPGAIFYHDDPAQLGTPFYLMERLYGRVFDQASLPGVPSPERRNLYRAMADALARLHDFDWRGAGLEDFGRAGDYYPRQLRRWKRFWTEVENISNPALNRVLAWLEDQPFPVEDTVISHGDYRLANVIFAPDRSEVAGILDWELATLGPSGADLAFSAICYHSGPDENGGLLGLDLPQLAIPSAEDYAAFYFQARDRSNELTLYERIFALFRAAAGSASIAARAHAGQGADEASAAFGERMSIAYAKGAQTLIEAYR